MKTLANAKDKAEIVRRLSVLGLGSKRQWGKMTVAEMVCHLNDALCVAMNEKQALPVSNLFSRSLMKWVALHTTVRWPHGISTVAECEPGKGGTPPTEFERDVKVLCAGLDRFTREPRGFDFAEHSIFGKLTEVEWQRWGYRHMDHHLRQFGA